MIKLLCLKLNHPLYIFGQCSDNKIIIKNNALKINMILKSAFSFDSTWFHSVADGVVGAEVRIGKATKLT